MASKKLTVLDASPFLGAHVALDVHTVRLEADHMPAGLTDRLPGRVLLLSAAAALLVRGAVAGVQVRLLFKALQYDPIDDHEVLIVFGVELVAVEDM